MRKVGRPAETLWDKVYRRLEYRDDTGCIEWVGFIDQDGYGKVTHQYRNMPIHRAIWEIHIGPIPKDLVVRHSCDNRKCGRLDHLALGTPDDNSKDMVARNRQAKGEANKGGGKLTEAQVSFIKAAISTPNAELAHTYGVSKALIGQIKNRRIWTHVN